MSLFDSKNLKSLFKNYSTTPLQYLSVFPAVDCVDGDEDEEGDDFASAHKRRRDHAAVAENSYA